MTTPMKVTNVDYFDFAKAFSELGIILLICRSLLVNWSFLIHRVVNDIKTLYSAANANYFPTSPPHGGF